MIKYADQRPCDILANRFGGNGEVQSTKLLTIEQFQGKGRLFARSLLKPGCSVGFHQHKGDSETF